ncbi:MAG: hypothetical protein Q4C60_10625, partial [Eubacteriales bacterium]|nr:hypothetical protein [Eubacteriales bacterium]
EDPETGETGKSDGAAKVPETERKILLTEIAELGEEISSQMVSFGTPQSELTLPAELTAVSESGESVTVAVSWSSEPAYEAEPEELRAGKPGAEEAESEALQVGKSETEEAEPEELRDTKPETEEADGSAAVKEEAQEGSSAEKENTGTESTLSEKNFLFTAALTQEAAGKYELAGEVLLPQIKVTMKAQEEEWEEPETEEKETEREYTASAGGVTVRAYAKRGVLPEEAVLTVEGLEDSDGSLAKTLRESGKEFDALLAVEVSFRADGQETEPAGPVRVVMEAGADRLSESVDGSSLALHHVTGDAVQTVAGADGENSGTITRTESGVTAEFTTESFSPFVFTWSQIKAAPAAKARAYDLYVYTLIPDKEENPSADPDTLWNGMNLGKIRAERSAASYSVNTRLREGDDSIQRWINNGTIQIQPAEFPPITYDGITYQYARTAEQESTVGYYTITWTKVIVSDGANRGNNGYFGQAVPSGTNTFHLDGVLNLNREGRYDVHFAVKDAGAEDFVIQEGYSRSVRENSPAGDIDRPDPDHHPVDYPRTKTADGVTYVFDGWYRDQACADRVEDWEREFVTQNVTYYARYIPQTLDLTVTKQVAGDMGDKQKQFHFSYSYPGADGEAVTGTFDLADGGSYMITGLAAGVVLTLTENNANGYDIAAEYGGRAEGVNVNEQTRQIQVTLSADRTELVVTNRKDVVPDTDVPLDSTPYLTMLALAAAGAVLLAKRRSIRDGK